MNMYVDQHDIDADSTGIDGKSTGKGLFRRRIVFELDAEQLPLLEAARERHGSMRAALIAGLRAETGAAGITERAEKAEAALGKAKSAAKGGSTAAEKAAKKLERDLTAARKKLASKEAELASLAGGAKREHRGDEEGIEQGRRESRGT